MFFMESTIDLPQSCELGTHRSYGTRVRKTHEMSASKLKKRMPLLQNMYEKRSHPGTITRMMTAALTVCGNVTRFSPAPSVRFTFVVHIVCCSHPLRPPLRCPRSAGVPPSMPILAQVAPARWALVAPPISEEMAPPTVREVVLPLLLHHRSSSTEKRRCS